MLERVTRTACGFALLRSETPYLLMGGRGFVGFERPQAQIGSVLCSFDWLWSIHGRGGRRGAGRFWLSLVDSVPG